MKSETLLISTLGTWSLIPEIIGFTNSLEFDLYRNSCNRESFKDIRSRNSIKSVDKIWLIGTDSPFFRQSKDKIEKWINSTGLCISSKYFILEGISDLDTQKDCIFFKDLIYRIVYSAVINNGFKEMYLCLAGGRKTMSSYLQSAATLFGYDAMFHVLQKNSSKNELEFLENFDFTEALPGGVADLIVPVVVSSGQKIDPVFYVRRSFLKSKLYLGVNEKVNRSNGSENFLNVVESIKKESSSLLYNYTQQVQSSGSSNFYALNFLHPELLEKLKTIRLGINRKADGYYLENFLKKLPKAELHFHFGGFADIPELIEIAVSNHKQIEYYSREISQYREWLEEVRICVGGDESTDIKLEKLKRLVPYDKHKFRNMFHDVREPYVVTGFILQFKENIELLEKFIFGDYLDERKYCGIGIEEYERLGDLQGSGILQSEESIRTACRILVDKCKKNNVKYLELRCSPNNYTRGGLTGEKVIEIIREELGKSETTIFSLIIIGSRHNDVKLLKEHINLAKYFIAKNDDRLPAIVGFDLAGNEEQRSAKDFRKDFLQLMRDCIKLTIHAGETQSVESIWEAVYHLSADRIGHGLKLLDNLRLMQHFIDRGIVVEMCPSSNYQIVGFKDNYLHDMKNSSEWGIYPLKQYLDKSVKVAVCTDNTGISRTDFSRELLKAARLSYGGLSLWEILLLVRNSFKGAFLPFGKKADLLREAEKEIVKLVLREIGNP